MKFHRPQKRDVSIEITPLIDVVFLLLIFFMVTSTTVRENILSIILPEAQGEIATQDNDDIQVLVSNEGVVMVNDVQLNTLSRDAVMKHISATFPNYPDARVVLGGDADVRHATIVLVLDALAELGVKNVSILVRESASD
ncbi:MAG: biopolymer transporter ExbD [Gammaproteobacteria bacterium]|nr:biopolymer transporter ExbD [Gammaproteobacteria bacterium]MYC25730.1 biopolymer transporter ExbD [Gammaproteobacteria bacterium]